MKWPDWGGMFIPDLSLLESFARASAVYLGLLILFRVVLKRQAGSLGLPDIMLVVLVSECVSPALGAESKSVTNGLVAVAALLFWSYALDRLSNHWPWLERLLEPEPVPLVRDGQTLTRNMEAEGISREELEAQIRAQGVADIRHVRSAILESDGQVSVIRAEASSRPDSPPETLEDALGQYRAAASNLEAALRRHEEAARAAREALRGVKMASEMSAESAPEAPPDGAVRV